MAAQDVAERVRQRADGLEADLREANKEIQNLQQQLHAQWQGGAVASSSARESVLELEVEKLRLQVNDYEALLSTDPSGSAPLHRQDSGAAVGLREAALERQIESLKLKLIESEAMQHSLSKASARCGSWGSRMSSNVSTEVLEESLAEFGMYIENLEEAVDHSTLRGQRREGNFCSLRLASASLPFLGIEGFGDLLIRKSFRSLPGVVTPLPLACQDAV